MIENFWGAQYNLSWARYSSNSATMEKDFLRIYCVRESLLPSLADLCVAFVIVVTHPRTCSSSVFSLFDHHPEILRNLCIKARPKSNILDWCKIFSGIFWLPIAIIILDAWQIIYVAQVLPDDQSHQEILTWQRKPQGPFGIPTFIFILDVFSDFICGVVLFCFINVKKAFYKCYK